MTSKLVHNAKHTVLKLTAEGKDWLDAHPLFGEDAELPQTAARLQDLAQQVGDGLITSGEADKLAERSINDELNTLDEETRRELIEKAEDAQFQQMMAELFGNPANAA
jgi:hypothetical protein